MNLYLLSQIREEKGFTQEGMSQKLNYKSKGSYCLIENGKSKITVELALSIKSILDLTEEEFKKIFFINEVQENQTLKI
ncbi:XRE family transcriptional regulator [Clostridium carboxidivorans P7]|uniref:Transcriptional regulator, XRE family n=1 Tax=Clostridium carboxidivorans P7 TaxID=536227 RepID=C6PZQ7_9CLOT|nr:helix-turn-helix transcriptional regulator [Clostridium carboxidivorans]AKN32631.1 XRE family transcriptional regulator [Clostridium carboxidivorans P7]EET85257.1 transcriptional regulator, XRE family [Clostridium carboxidivorans P7]EFG90146.1 helix-turn-helix domain-containing protein [Clostridium carboxidivorans P7]